jgi:phage terminase large subunit GpA-like protein
MNGLWTPAERRAWRWPSRILPTQWAESAPRMIPDNGSNPEPGPYKIDRTPYLREVLDTVVAENVEQIVFLKCTQVGWTTGLQNLLGYWIDVDPGACLVVMPDEQSARDIMGEQIIPMIKGTPALARHMSERAWDTKAVSIRLDTMPIFAAWAGSPQRLASRPIRFVLFDEVDKFPMFSGREADPISLGLKRISNWKARARALIGSTPTTRHGEIWRRWDVCGDKRHFWVPCPHCGEFQQLVWSQVKWPDMKAEEEDRTKRAELIEAGHLAWYECCSCQAKIEDKHKTLMLSLGKWASEDQVVTKDGRIVGPRPAARRIGFALNSLYSPWLTYSQLVGEWLRAQGDPARLMDFINSRLAEPFEERVIAPKDAEFAEKAEAARKNKLKSRLVPAWAGALFATVDVQQSGFWIVVRAWGHKYRSRLVWHGFLRGWDELYDSVVNQLWNIEGGGQARVQLCLIDSGGGTAQDSHESRTQEVYRFCERAPGLIVPVKGAAIDQIRTVRASPYAKDARGNMVPLYTLNVGRLKDELMRLVRVPAGGDGEWELNEDVDADFLRQMTSEHKITIDARTQERRWVRKGTMPNHLWDCCVYQIAAADPDLGKVGMIPPPEEIEAARKQQVANEERRGNDPMAATFGGVSKKW